MGETKPERIWMMEEAAHHYTERDDAHTVQYARVDPPTTADTPKDRAMSFKSWLAEQMKDQEFAEAYKEISAEEDRLLREIFSPSTGVEAEAWALIDNLKRTLPSHWGVSWEQDEGIVLRIITVALSAREAAVREQCAQKCDAIAEGFRKLSLRKQNVGVEKALQAARGAEECATACRGNNE